MAVSSIHVELDKFFHETRGLNKDNCWEWFESFRNTLLYKGYEENPHPYALALLDETECYSAYCAVCNIEGRVIAELERKKETFDFEKVYKICMEKKGSDYAQLKEKESRYLELHPEANRWRDNNRAPSTKSKAKKNHEKHDAEQTRNDTEPPKPQATEMKKTPDQLVWGKFENVFLTQKQHDDFCVHVGNVNEAKQIIDSLSCKLEDGSFNSSKHYATLIHWSNYRKEKAAEAAEMAKVNADARAEAYSKRGYKTAEERQQEELAKIKDFCTGLRNGTIKIAKEG